MRNSYLATGVVATVILASLAIWGLGSARRGRGEQPNLGPAPAFARPEAIALPERYTVELQRKAELQAELAKLKPRPAAVALPPGAIPVDPSTMGQLGLDMLKAGTEQSSRLLLSSLALPPHSREAVIDLLAAYSFRKINRTDLEGALRDTLRPEQTELVMASLDASVAWSRVQDFDERLRVVHQSLSDVQRKSLLDLVGTELQPLPKPQDDGAIGAAIRQRQEGNRRLLEKAAAFLDATQLKVLAVELADQIALQHVTLYKMKNDLLAEAARGKPKT